MPSRSEPAFGRSVPKSAKRSWRFSGFHRWTALSRGRQEDAPCVEKLNVGRGFLDVRGEAPGRAVSGLYWLWSGSSSALETDSSACTQNFWDANEIVDGCDENEVLPPHLVLGKPPIVFLQPNGCSIRFRLVMLMA